MNKAQGRIVGGAIVAAVVIGIIAAVAYDFPEADESQFEMPIEDPVTISDSIELNETEAEFVVDEEGKKTYIIDVGDAPDFGEK